MPRRELPSAKQIRARVRVLFDSVPTALAGDADGIHDLRVHGRRLRVTLPVLVSRPGSKRLRRAARTLRTLVRSAGYGRDMDVSLELFEAFVADRDDPAPEWLGLRRSLRGLRTRSRRQTLDAVLDVPISRLRDDLRALAAEPSEFMVVRRINAARDAVAEDVRRRLTALDRGYDAEALHVLRRRIRRLRYLAELRDALRGRDSAAPARFKRLQSRLGDLHDTHVLATWLERQAARASRAGRTAAAGEAQSCANEFRRRSRAHHDAFLASDPASSVDQGVAEMSGRQAVA